MPSGLPRVNPWTFSAPSVQQMDDYASAAARFQSRVGGALAYRHTGTFERHWRLHVAARGRRDQALLDLAMGWGDACCVALASIIKNARQVEIARSGGDARAIDIRCMRLVMSFLAIYRGICRVTDEARLLQFIRSETGTGATSFDPVSIDPLREVLDLASLHDHKGVGGVAIGIVCGTLNKLDDKSLVRTAICAPLSLSPDEFDSVPNWVDELSTEEVSTLAEESIAHLTTIVDQAIIIDRKAYLRIRKSVSFLSGRHDKEILNVDRLPFWEWLALAYIEHYLDEGFIGVGSNLRPIFLERSHQYAGNHWLWQLVFARHSATPEFLTEAIVTLVERPRHIKKLRVPKGGSLHEFKAVLLRLAEVFVGGIRVTVEFKHLQREFAKSDAPLARKVWLVSQFLAFTSIFHRDHPSYCRDLQFAAGHAAAGAGCIIEGAVCVLADIQLQTPDDAEFARLLDQEAANSRRISEEIQQWIASNTPKVEDPVVGDGDSIPTIPITLVYVANLGAVDWRGITFQSTNITFNDDFQRFLMEHSIDTMVPASSVASALRHFIFDMSPEQRRQIQGEEIAGVWWRKLKRGKQRIYVIERDDVLYINLLKRKDWEKAEVLARRF